MISIAVDGMGGDTGPEVVVRGLSLLHKRRPDVRFLLFGDLPKLRALITRCPDLAEVTDLIHSEEVVAVDTKPSYAVRNLKNSSMRMALEAVADGRADGTISCGNTGAYMALSKLILKTLPGIDRPAIARSVPTQRSESILLDLGGSLSCSARNLIEYGIMGVLFARHVFGIPNPSVGLLNVGSEETKGGEVLQEAAAGLRESVANFYGFVEGMDIFKGTVDVIVTDGFTGNVALKTAEGVSNLLMGSLKRTLSSSLRGFLSAWVARPFLKALRNRFDPRFYNGAIWLGLNGVAVKSHGASDEVGFAYAVETVIDMIEAKLVSVISEEIGSELQVRRAAS